MHVVERAGIIDRNKEKHHDAREVRQMYNDSSRKHKQQGGFFESTEGDKKSDKDYPHIYSVTTFINRKDGALIEQDPFSGLCMMGKCIYLVSKDFKNGGSLVCCRNSDRIGSWRILCNPISIQNISDEIDHQEFRQEEEAGFNL